VLEGGISWAASAPMGALLHVGLLQQHVRCERKCERQLDLVENRTRVMRAPTRGLAKALRGIYWGGGGGPALPPARSVRPACGV
jgi:hypothetical protein